MIQRTTASPSLDAALSDREEGWAALYRGAMMGAQGHRRTGYRTAEKRAANARNAAPLPGHVDAATAHDGFVDAALRVPAALRYAPQPRTGQRVVGSTTAFQERVAQRPSKAAPGMPERSRTTSAIPVREAHWENDPSERLAILEEAAAILATLPEATQDTLRMMREGEVPEDVKPSAWSMRKARAVDAVRAAIADRA